MTLSCGSPYDVIAWFQGSTIEPLVNFLKVKKADSRKPTIGEKIVYRVRDLAVMSCIRLI